MWNRIEEIFKKLELEYSLLKTIIGIIIKIFSLHLFSKALSIQVEVFTRFDISSIEQHVSIFALFFLLFILNINFKVYILTIKCNVTKVFIKCCSFDKQCYLKGKTLVLGKTKCFLMLKTKYFKKHTGL